MIIGASGGSGIIFIIAIAFLLIWLIVVRPQKKRQNQQQIANELRIGDEVLTAGGIYGTVSGIADDEVTVQIAPKTEVRVARRAIASVSRDPEEDAAAAADESEDEGGEKWQSAFDEDDAAKGETSTEENRG